MKGVTISHPRTSAEAGCAGLAADTPAWNPTECEQCGELAALGQPCCALLSKPLDLRLLQAQKEPLQHGAGLGLRLGYLLGEGTGLYTTLEQEETTLPWTVGWKGPPWLQGQGCRRGQGRGQLQEEQPGGSPWEGKPLLEPRARTHSYRSGACLCFRQEEARALKSAGLLTVVEVCLPACTPSVTCKLINGELECKDRFAPVTWKPVEAVTRSATVWASL